MASEANSETPEFDDSKDGEVIQDEIRGSGHSGMICLFTVDKG